uniref:PID domain-containing protein n=1 Tax=Haemonchus placei TaxID=6290 RepID=A0A0N4W615_HAEPC
MDFSLSVYYLGFTKVRFFERNIGKNSTSLELYRSNEENVIDQIETAQLDGLLPMDANGLRKVIAMVVKARQCEPEYKCHVLQCTSMREADEFLRKTHQLFDSVIDTIDQREADQCEWVDV